MKYKVLVFVLALISLVYINEDGINHYKTRYYTKGSTTNDRLNNSIEGDYLSGYYALKNSDYANADYYLNTLSDKANILDSDIIAISYFTTLLNKGVGEALSSLEKEHGTEKVSIAGPLILAIDQIKHGNYLYASNLFRIEAGKSKGLNSEIANIAAIWSDFATNEELDKIKQLEVYKNTDLEPLATYHQALMYEVVGNTDMADKLLTNITIELSGSYQKTKHAIAFFEKQGKYDQVAILMTNYDLRHDALRIFEYNQAKSAAYSKPNIDQAVADLMFELANSNFEKLPLESVVYLRIADHLDDEYADFSHFLVGTIYELRGNISLANEEYKKIAKDSEFYSYARLNMAGNLENSEQLPTAITLLEVMDKNHKIYPVKFAMGQMLYKDGQYAQASEIFSELINNNEAPENLWMHYFIRGASYDKLGESDKAETDLLQAYKLNSSSYEVMNYIAYSWLERRKCLKKASELARKAYEIAYYDPSIMDTMALALFIEGKYEEAAVLAENAAEIIPDDPIVNERLGDIYWELGRKLQAKFQWKKLLNNQNNDVDKEKLLYKINYLK